MKFEISPMLVTEMRLSPNSDESKDGHNNQFKFRGALDFTDIKSSSVRLLTEVELTSFGKYEIHFNAEFAVKFEAEVTEEEAEKILDDANLEANIFPYVSSYASAFITLSGYRSPRIPVLFFNE
jgi:hypothetical protein